MLGNRVWSTFTFFAVYHSTTVYTVMTRPPVEYAVVLSQGTAGAGWRRGVVVSGVRCMNEVNTRRARLVLGWVTIFGQVYHLGM